MSTVLKIIFPNLTNQSKNISIINGNESLKCIKKFNFYV